MNRIKMNKV